MSQSTSESVYAGRKIRTAATEESMNDTVENATVSYLTDCVAEDGMTLGEAAYRGYLKTGMGVVFKNCNFGPVTLTQMQTGEKQDVTFGFSKGVVFKKKNGDYAIFTVLQIPSIPNRGGKNPIIFSGRFGRANMYSTLETFVENSSLNFANGKVSTIDLKEFCEYISKDQLIFEYFLTENYYGNFCFFMGKGSFANIRIHNFEMCGVNVDPKINRKETVYNIGVVLEGQNLWCFPKKCNTKVIREHHTYNNNPFDTYIEIRGTGV